MFTPALGDFLPRATEWPAVGPRGWEFAVPAGELEMLGNDVLGICGPAGAMHFIQTETANAGAPLHGTLAQTIADRLVTNFKDPVSYIPYCDLRATFSAQLGDRATVVDENLDLSDDYVVVGMNHKLMADVTSGDVGTMMTLMKVPAGS